VSRAPLDSVVPDHDTRTRTRAGCRWQALCSCGWWSSPNLKWAVSARDAAAGHLLDVTR
jgi:hypothetical protein